MCVASDGRGHDKRAYSYLAYMLVQFNCMANAAYLDCGVCGNNVLKLAESFPDRNHINCTKITGLQITNCSGKMQIHNLATVRPNRLSPRSKVIETISRGVKQGGGVGGGRNPP